MHGIYGLRGSDEQRNPRKLRLPLLQRFQLSPSRPSAPQALELAWARCCALESDWARHWASTLSLLRLLPPLQTPRGSSFSESRAFQAAHLFPQADCSADCSALWFSPLKDSSRASLEPLTGAECIQSLMLLLLPSLLSEVRGHLMLLLLPSHVSEVRGRRRASYILLLPSHILSAVPPWAVRRGWVGWSAACDCAAWPRDAHTAHA